MKFYNRFIPPVVLFLFTFALYSSTFHAEFHFDDHAYIIESPEILSLSKNLIKLKNNTIRPDRMLVTISFALNHHMHGFELPGYHFVNILVHCLNGVLIYLLLTHLSSTYKRNNLQKDPDLSKYLPFTAAALFLCHPVAVNSVTYITQRHVLMATLFYLSGFTAYVVARQARLSKKVIWFFICFLCFWAAIHCKPMTLTFPFVLIAYELVWFSRSKHSWYKIFLVSLFLFCVTCGLLVLYAFKSGLFSHDAALAGFATKELWSPWQHFLTESVVFIHYWKILLLPLTHWLSADHYFPVITTISGAVIASWIIHLSIWGTAFLSYRRGFKFLAFGVLWFYITIIPPYLFLPIKDVMVDYKTYLPSIGLFLIFSEISQIAISRYGNKPLLAVVAVTCIAYTCLTFQRNSIFFTEESFWSDIIKKYPTESRPYNNRGLTYFEQKRFDKAIADFNKAIILNPRLSHTYANLGDVYQRMGEVPKALYNYETSFKLNPKNADTITRIANIHARQGNWNKALELYKRSTVMEPDNPVALYNLGLALAQLGDLNQAVEIYSQVYQLDKSHSKSLTSIGAIEFQNGNITKAKEYFLKSLEIEPDSAETLYNISACYIKEGNQESARRSIERLLNINPKRGKLLLDHLEKLQ